MNIHDAIKILQDLVASNEQLISDLSNEKDQLKARLRHIEAIDVGKIAKFLIDRGHDIDNIFGTISGELLALEDYRKSQPELIHQKHQLEMTIKEQEQTIETQGERYQGLEARFRHIEANDIGKVVKLLGLMGYTTDDVVETISSILDGMKIQSDSLNKMHIHSNELRKEIKQLVRQLGTAHNERDGLQESCSNYQETIRGLEAQITGLENCGNEYKKLLDKSEKLREKYRVDNEKLYKQLGGDEDATTIGGLNWHEKDSQIQVGDYFFSRDGKLRKCVRIYTDKNNTVAYAENCAGYIIDHCRTATWDEVFPVDCLVTANYCGGTMDGVVVCVPRIIGYDDRYMKAKVKFVNNQVSFIHVNKLSRRIG